VTEVANQRGEILIYKGVVAFDLTGKRRIFAEREKILEDWLLQTGKEHIEPAVYDYALKMING
jgi:hypothetical protein